MIKYLAVAIMCIQCAFAAQIHIPKNWTPVEITAELPSSIRSMVHAVSPTEEHEISVSVMDIVMSLEEAVTSHIRGASKKGFQHHSTSETSYKGYESRIIKGHISLPDSDDVILVESYIILTQDCMVLVSVYGSESASVITEVLDWIEFSSESNTTTSKAANKTGRSLWEHLGMALVFGAVGYAIYSSISSRRKKNGQQAGTSNGG